MHFSRWIHRCNVASRHSLCHIYCHSSKVYSEAECSMELIVFLCQRRQFNFHFLGIPSLFEDVRHGLLSCLGKLCRDSYLWERESPFTPLKHLESPISNTFAHVQFEVGQGCWSRFPSIPTLPACCFDHPVGEISDRSGVLSGKMTSIDKLMPKFPLPPMSVFLTFCLGSPESDNIARTFCERIVWLYSILPAITLQIYCWDSETIRSSFLRQQ